MGEGYGPKLVLNRAGFAAGADRLIRDDAGSVRAILASKPEIKIAVPGVQTTAFACLCMLMDWSGLADWAGRVVERPFDEILPAVERADSQDSGGVIGAGVLIHQSQLTYGDHGVMEAIDFEGGGGRRPGCRCRRWNAVRRDLDVRYGPGTPASLVELFDRSVRTAEHASDRSSTRSGGHQSCRSIRSDVISTYASDLTVDMGANRRHARLLREALTRVVCTAFVRPVPGHQTLRSIAAREWKSRSQRGGAAMRSLHPDGSCTTAYSDRKLLHPSRR